MGLRYLSYTAIPQAKRISSGHIYLKALRDALKVPGIDPGEKANLEAEIQRINEWMNGTLSVTPPPGVPEFTSP